VIKDVNVNATSNVKEVHAVLISNNDLKKMVCIVCMEKFGDHSKNGWMKCLFRLQGTIAMNDISAANSE